MNLSNYTIGFQTIESSQPVNIIVQSFQPMDMILIFFGLYITVIFIHELGHLYALRSAGKDSTLYVKLNGLWPTFTAGVEEDYKTLTPSQRITIYLWGIGAGCIPIFLAMTIHPLYVLTFLVYMFGIFADYDNIILAWKELNSKELKHN